MIRFHIVHYLLTILALVSYSFVVLLWRCQIHTICSILDLIISEFESKLSKSYLDNMLSHYLRMCFQISKIFNLEAVMFLSFEEFRVITSFCVYISMPLRSFQMNSDLLARKFSEVEPRVSLRVSDHLS